MNDELKNKLSEIENVLNYGLPENIDMTIQNSFFGKSPCIVPEAATQLALPCRELMRRGGKRWRPLLAVLSCELAGGDVKDIYPLTPLVEFCHTASLIHDDIEDNSGTRRGEVAIHLKYGTDVAINAGSWLYFHALNCINSYNADAELKNGLYHLYIRTVQRLHLGQAMDIAWHSDPEHIPNREEYLTMIALKTGTLAKFAGELGFSVAGRPETDVAEFGMIASDVGTAFQILDDIKNITTGNAGKKRGDDIVERKKSLPVVFCIEKTPLLKEKICKLFNKAAAEGIESPAVEECISIIVESGAIREAEKYAKDIVETSLNKFRKSYRNDKVSDLILELFGSIL